MSEQRSVFDRMCSCRLPGRAVLSASAPTTHQSRLSRSGRSEPSCTARFCVTEGRGRRGRCGDERGCRQRRHQAKTLRSTLPSTPPPATSSLRIRVMAGRACATRRRRSSSATTALTAPRPRAHACLACRSAPMARGAIASVRCCPATRRATSTTTTATARSTRTCKADAWRRPRAVPASWCASTALDLRRDASIRCRRSVTAMTTTATARPTKAPTRPALDENFGCSADSAGRIRCKGVCEAGIRRCEAGQLAEECSGQTKPDATERCGADDGVAVDEDCDGHSDETCPCTGS